MSHGRPATTYWVSHYWLAPLVKTVFLAIYIQSKVITVTTLDLHNLIGVGV